MNQRALIACALLALGAAASGSASAANCAIASQRDATCVGSQNSDGTHPVDNQTLSLDPRGANAKLIAGVPMPAPSTTNSCVTVPFVTWAYDPVSYGTPAPSFVTPAGSGYLGSGGSGSPLDACASDSDGSCAAWVPTSHPYLFLGGANFVQCAGATSQGSVSCPVSGGAAYVTTNPNAGFNFAAFMIACKNNTQTVGMQLLGAPFSWWSSCTGSSSCSFYILYPPPPDQGGNGL